jgi:hypothetical protein
VPDSIKLPSGTQAHWLGNRSAKKVFVYFNGRSPRSDVRRIRLI